MDLIALSDLVHAHAWGGAMDILAKNMILTSLFQVKIDCRVFWTPARHHKNRMEACYVFRLLFFTLEYVAKVHIRLVGFQNVTLQSLHRQSLGLQMDEISIFNFFFFKVKYPFKQKQL